MGGGDRVSQQTSGGSRPAPRVNRPSAAPALMGFAGAAVRHEVGRSFAACRTIKLHASVRRPRSKTLPFLVLFEGSVS